MDRKIAERCLFEKFPGSSFGPRSDAPDPNLLSNLDQQA
jgi:hypothetical protein